MSLLELNLEKPAYKRVTEPGTDETEVEVAEAPTTETDGSGGRPTIGIAVLLAAVVAALAIKRRRS